MIKMASILAIILMILICHYLYGLIIHPLYIKQKYKKDVVGIPLERVYTNAELMQLLKESLQYPDLKELYQDETGAVVLDCVYGKHRIIIENGALFVERKIFGIDNAQACYVEEAECIKKYIQRIFDPNQTKDAEHFYHKMKRFQKKRFRLGILILIIFVLFGVMTFSDKFSYEKLIQESYLTEYSEDITIGRAFSNFFGEEEWKAYEIGTKQYVDFTGTCEFDGQDAYMTITFLVFGDAMEGGQFYVDSVKINNMDVPDILIDGLFQKIYQYAVPDNEEELSFNLDDVSEVDTTSTPVMEEPSEPAQPVKQDGIDNYLGEWYITDYGMPEIGENGETISSGTTLSIYKDGNQYKLDMMALYHSTAFVGVDGLVLNVNGNLATTSYEEDGWNNCGDITLEFANGELYVTATAIQMSDPYYGDAYNLAADHMHCTRVG